MESSTVFNPRTDVDIYKHTKHPHDRDPVLNSTLGVPAVFLVPERGKAPETTFDKQFFGPPGYVEKPPHFLRWESGTLIGSAENAKVHQLLRTLERDLYTWELERSVEVVHRSDGLLRFLKKINPALAQDKRHSWLERIVQHGCSLRSLAAADEIPFQQPSTTKSLSPLVELFTERKFAAPRATWYLKTILLRQQWKDRSKRPRQLSSRNSSGRLTGEMSIEASFDTGVLRKEWTKLVAEYMIGKLWDIAAAAPVTVSGIRSNRRQNPANTSTATIQPCTINVVKLGHWDAAFRIFCWQYEMGLLCKDMFLEKLLGMVQKMRSASGLQTKIGHRGPLPLALCFHLVSKVCLFIREIAQNHLYEFWRVCTENLRQLMWVGSYSQVSLYYDPNFKPLCGLLHYGLEFARAIAQDKVAIWGKLLWNASREERDAFKASRLAERSALELNTDHTPTAIEQKCSELAATSYLGVVKYGRCRDLDPSTLVRINQTNTFIVPTRDLNHGVMLKRSPSKSGERARDENKLDDGKPLDSWLLLESVSNTASLSRILADARRVRRTARFQI